VSDTICRCILDSIYIRGACRSSRVGSQEGLDSSCSSFRPSRGGICTPRDCHSNLGWSDSPVCRLGQSRRDHPTLRGRCIRSSHCNIHVDSLVEECICCTFHRNTPICTNIPPACCNILATDRILVCIWAHRTNPLSTPANILLPHRRHTRNASAHFGRWVFRKPSDKEVNTHTHTNKRINQVPAFSIWARNELAGHKVPPHKSLQSPKNDPSMTGWSLDVSATAVNLMAKTSCDDLLRLPVPLACNC
jgi:hypothetical protein